MKSYLRSLFVAIFLCQAMTAVCQCQQNPFTFPTCEVASAHVLTDVDALDNVCFVMPTGVSGGSQPMPLCSDQQNTAAENISWLAFEVPMNGMAMEIIPTNCQGSSSGNEGMQVGIYSDCTFSEAVFCNSACNLSPITIPSEVFVGGEEYFLFIDGCNGSVCQYELVMENSNVTGDPCISPVELFTSTETDCDLSIVALADSGSFDLQCLEEFAQCDVTGPTTWHKITVDNPAATKLVTQVLSDSIDVVWSVYRGNDPTSATRMQGINHSTNGLYTCSNSDGQADNVHVVPILDNSLQTYWLAITAVSEISSPEYVVNYYTTVDCTTCVSSSATDFEYGTITAFVDGEKSDGPFCQGQEVEVCIDFLYDASSTGNDWLHGIIPVFGAGWEVDESVLSQLSPFAESSWFSSAGMCAPRLNGYDVPNLCTYVEDGVLKMKSLLESPTDDCLGILEDGAPLPSGWFITFEGGSSTCGLDCSPASFWGSPQGVVVNVELCMPLTVKSSQVGCMEGQDLQIKVFPTSDAITGCWEDAQPCRRIVPFVSPEWKTTCDEAGVNIITAVDDTVCSGSAVDQVVTITGDTAMMLVTFDDNPDVSGEGTGPGWDSGTLTINQTGTIGDILVNTSDIAQSVRYRFAPMGNTSCSQGATSVLITIPAPIVIDFASDQTICEGDCIALSPTVTSNGLTDITWSDGSTGLANTVCPVSTTTYTVTVTDSDGCTATESITVIVSDTLFSSVDISLCEGESVTIGDQQYSEPGIYTAVLPTMTGCDSVIELSLTVLPLPEIIGAGLEACVGESSALFPVSGVLWMSTTPDVCLVSDDGTLTTIASGQCIVSIVDELTGCSSEPTVIEVLDPPILELIGDETVCVGDSVVITSTATGLWSSSDDNVAMVNNNGVVSPVGAGEVVITLSDDLSNCTSSISLTVLDPSDPMCTTSSTYLEEGIFSLYPNPAVSTLHYDSELPVTSITLIGTDGRRLPVSNALGKEGTIDVHHMPTGLYILEVVCAGKRQYRKVLLVE